VAEKQPPLELVLQLQQEKALLALALRPAEPWSFVS
jgi:hypothetical protein